MKMVIGFGNQLFQFKVYILCGLKSKYQHYEPGFDSCFIFIVS